LEMRAFILERYLNIEKREIEILLQVLVDSRCWKFARFFGGRAVSVSVSKVERRHFLWIFVQENCLDLMCHWNIVLLFLQMYALDLFV